MIIDKHIQTIAEPQFVENEEQKFFRNAEVLFSNKDWSLARVIFSDLHIKNPSHSLYLERLAQCYAEMGEADNAAIAFDSLIKQDPSFKNLVLCGNFYLEQKNFVRAKKSYMKAICHQEEDFLMLFDLFKNLGNISMHEGDFEQAEEYYNKAQRIFDGSDLLYVNYGSLYLQKKDFDKSIEAFQMAIHINEKSSKARLGLSLLYREKNEIDLAWANLRAAADFDPVNVSCLKMMAQWALADYRYDVATECLERYIERNQYHQELNVLLACIYFQAGFRDACYWECQKIIEFDPSNADTLKLLELLEKHDEL